MIEKLTDENQAQIPLYVKKWIGIGLDTARIDRVKAKADINKLYELILKKPLPEEILFFDSPLALWKHVQGVVGSKISFVWPYLSGSLDAHVFAFYDYCLNELKIAIPEDLMEKYRVWKATSEMGFIYPFDDVCLVCEKAVEIHTKDGRLHRESGPALKYADGFSVWALNGVRMKQEYVETPWNQLNCDLVVKETNAEVRRELVRKIGVERIVEQLGAEIIDKQGDYELMLLNIGGVKRPYLKMLNPSIGTYHIEGVPPNTLTVKAALVFRNGTDETPEVLT